MAPSHCSPLKRLLTQPRSLETMFYHHTKAASFQTFTHLRHTINVMWTAGEQFLQAEVQNGFPNKD